MGMWRSLIDLFKSSRSGLSVEEQEQLDYLKKLGLSTIPEMVRMETQSRRLARETEKEMSTHNPSTAPSHGSALGTVLKCAICEREMTKVGNARGSIALTPEEMDVGVGPAEECRECGRAYCDRCMRERRAHCICGINQQVVRVDQGVSYRGSLVLVKVRYVGGQSSAEQLPRLSEALTRVNQLNADLMRTASAQNWSAARRLMIELGESVRELGVIGGEHAIKPIVDAIGDAAQAYANTGFPEAKGLTDTAIDALAQIGPASMSWIEKGIKDSRPAVAQAFRRARGQITNETA